MKIGVDIRALIDKEYSGVSWYAVDLLRASLEFDRKNEYILYYNSFKDLSGRLPEFNYPNAETVFTRFPNKIFNYFFQKIFHWPKLDILCHRGLSETKRSISQNLSPDKLVSSARASGGGVDVFWSPHLNFSSFSKNCRNVLTVHDLSFLIHPEFFSVRKNFWHYFIGVKKAIKRAEAVIAVSENTKNDIVRLIGVPEEKIKVIYSGFNPEFQLLRRPPVTETVARRYGLPKNFIFFMGTIEPRKNIAGLIRAFDMISPDFEDYELIIAGGRGWKDTDVFRAFRSAKNKDKIKFLGYVGEKEKPCLYNLASLFVYPSFYEGFGFPPLEAQACRTPVVAGNISSLPEALGASALLVDPNDVNALAKAMKLVLRDEKLRDELTKRGLENVKRFDWKKSAEEYVKIFNG